MKIVRFAMNYQGFGNVLSLDTPGDISGEYVPLAEAEALADRVRALEKAIADAVESAEEEGVHRYRGTDVPRAFVSILRAALNAPEPTT